MKRSICALISLLMLAAVVSGCSLKDPASEKQEPLPEYFSLADEGRVSPSKRQNSTGLCWDYASIATAESVILSKGLADSVDLSEGHLFYYFYPYAAERPADSTEEGIYIHGRREDSPELPLNMGGDIFMAFSLFANGAGPANEADAPLDTDSAKLSESVAALTELEHSGKMTKYQGDWLLTDISSYENKPMETLKRSIMENGALCTGIVYDLGKICRTGEENSYYTGVAAENYGTDHALVLIGWDDGYSRDNFGGTKPENDGAWIALDTTDLLSEEDGIVYISYEENIPGCVSVDMCRRDDYSDVLHYDFYAGDLIREPEGETVIANVFSADKDTSLKAVGLYTADDAQPLTVEVFVNPGEGKPDSGRRAAKIRATPEIKGYHVVELPKPAALSAGDTFSIVVSYECGDGEFTGAAAVEGSLEQYSNLFAKPYITSNAGESFALHDGVWYDTSRPETAAVFGKEYCLNNAAIKALIE